MNMYILLDIAAALLILALCLAGAYEALAFINMHVPFTANFPLITAIVRPWIMAHKAVALAIAAVIVAAFMWLFWHFYLPA